MDTMSHPITPDRIAAQFYTLRELTKSREGFRQALEHVAELGYKGVQLSAVGAMNDGLVSADETRKWLDELDLKCVATHRPFERFQTNLEDEVAFHKALGCDYTAVGYFLHRYPNSLEGFNELVSDSGPIVSALANQGIRFGIHNHDAEFRRTNGKLHFDVLIERGAPDLMLEIDTFWVVKAGVDCAWLLERCAGRIPMIHVKDLEMAEGGSRMAPVGEGNLPWDDILTAGEKSGVEVYIVEQDDTFRDPFDCLHSSLEYLKAWSPRE
jgi:sugar phosphate isomerase/epimerase